MSPNSFIMDALLCDDQIQALKVKETIKNAVKNLGVSYKIYFLFILIFY